MGGAVRPRGQRGLIVLASGHSWTSLEGAIQLTEGKALRYTTATSFSHREKYMADM